MRLGGFVALSALSFGRRGGARGDSVGDGIASIDEVQDHPRPPPIEEDSYYAHAPVDFDRDDYEDDARFVGESFGISVEEARKYLDQQEDFAELLGALSNDENFVIAHYAETFNGEFKIFYNDAATPPQSPRIIEVYRDAIEKFRATNRDASLTFVKVRLSKEEGERRRDRIVANLRRKGYSMIVSSIDGDNLEVTAKKPTKRSWWKNRGIMDKFRAAEILGLSGDDDDLNGLHLELRNGYDEDPFEYYHGHGYGGQDVHDKTCVSGFSMVDWCLALI